jgi:site-specific DNA-methyltransferase (adenine-specific)
MLDVIFGAKNFRSEVVWKRTSSHNSAKRWGPIHDILLFYSKSDDFTWNPQFLPYDEEYIEKNYRYVDPKTGKRYTTSDLTGPGVRQGPSGQAWRGIDPSKVNRHWQPPSYCYWKYQQLTGEDLAQYPLLERLDKLDEVGLIHWPDKEGGMPRHKRFLEDMPGAPVQDVIDDINPVPAQSAERLGYPTQKPLALLERIIQASSNEGDLVLDPFCGCGTAIVAAEKLRRQWIGIDITHLAIALIKYRLSDMFGLQERKDYQVIGEPTTEAEARALAQQDRDEFQKWAIGLIPRARPYQEKKGADTGIDGVLRFQDDPKAVKTALIQVKSGKVGVEQVRDFAHVVNREGATLGLFLTLEPPTSKMLEEAGKLGFYITPLGNIRIPRLQIRTVAQLLAGEGFQIPSTALLMGVAQAQRIERDAGQQEMEME